MLPRRALIGLTGLAAVAAAAFAAPARAQTPDTLPPGVAGYRATSTATALELNVLGQSITLGQSNTSLGNLPISLARGIGALLPGAGNVMDQKYQATSNGTTAGSATEACGPISLPPSVPVVSLASACSSALAKIVDGLPASAATGRVATLAVGTDRLLGQLPLKQITSAVDQLLAGLKPVFDQLKTTGVDANTLISQILDGITGTGQVVRVNLGPSSSSTSTTSAVAQALGTAQGATVEILPRDALGLAPVLTIAVGAASSTVSVDRTTGQATSSYEPSLVKLTLADDIAAALPAIPKTTSVAPGQRLCLTLPAPLGETCIEVANGARTPTPDGGMRAEANGVSIQALKGLPGGGVQLALAKTSVEAAAIAVQPLAAPPAAEAPPALMLPRTGGTESPLAWVLLGMGGLGVIAYSRVRRQLSAN